jgi:hypothetical protein
LSDTHAQLDYLGLDDAGGGAALFFTFVEGVYIDPCHLEQGFLDPPPGPTVDEMAAALARIPGVSVTGPTDSTIGGYPAVTLSLTAPPAFEGCTGETDGPPFRLWGVPGWMAMDPGQRLRLWIVAVDGHRLMIGSQESADASPEALAAVNTLLATLQIEPEGEVARASPPPNELCNPCSPLPPGGPLAEGRYAVAMNLHRYVGDTPIPLSRPHRVTFDIVFGGWSSTDNGTATRSGASLTFWSVARIYRDPCHWRTSGMGAVEPTELGQLDSLARAFWDAWTPGMDGPGQGAPPFAPAVTEPIDETRYYHFAKRLKVKVPADVDVATCDGGEYRMWEDLEGRARAAREPGEHIRLWVVDLSPGLLVVDASSLPETLSADRGELDAMITSIWVELPRADAGP